MSLSDYRKNTETESCYLDGRYFNKVFKDYPGLIKNPLVIHFKKTKNGMEQYAEMKSSDADTDYLGLLRVIINTPDTRHSNLVLIDYQGQKVYRFEPLGIKAPYFKLVNKIIESYLDMYLDFELINFENSEFNEKNPNCKKGGFCVAYVIKFAYDFFNKNPYDPSDIRKFAKQIEDVCGPLPKWKKDVEYGLFDNVSGRNVAIGAIGGGVLGGLITRSPGGALIGAGGGALIGGLIPK